MWSLLTEAEAREQRLRAGLTRAADEMRARLDRGESIPVEEIKNWRRSCVDQAVEVRDLAKQAEGEGDGEMAFAIRELARTLEEQAREFEDELVDLAEPLQEASARGGLLTPEERARQAADQTGGRRQLACQDCGTPIPDSQTTVCPFCRRLLDGKRPETKTNTGWLALQEEAESGSGSASAKEESSLARIEALVQTYTEQLEVERQGLMQVLEAGRGDSDALQHAFDDAEQRLDLIWERIRQVGQKAGRRLGELEGETQEETLDEQVERRVEQACEQLDKLCRSVFDGVQREAALAWDHRDLTGDTRILCSHCGRDLGITDYRVAGTKTCDDCGTVTTYIPRQSRFDVAVGRRVDAQMQEQRPLEEEFRRWQQACIMDPSDANMAQLEVAARAMYGQQLFYIKDPLKRRVAVERYVEQALKEAARS